MLERDCDLSRLEILSMIESAPRLKVAVRGWVAEKHLGRVLREMSIVKSCAAIEEDGRPDLQ